jgi:hypothetical protein
MANRKVLIITYYWPPSGGSGVQRWLKFVKYLVPLGWEPYVYTPENPSFTIHDSSLLNDIPPSVEVIKLPIWEPYNLFFKLSGLLGKKQVKQSDFISTGKKSLFGKISSWMRGNLFIPDARVFWVKPSVTFLNDFIRSNEIQKIITTGPPHSVHLIGLKLKKKNPSMKWIADFRDPWSEWDLLDTLSLSRWAKARHKFLERTVLQQADRVITIAPYHVALFEKLGRRKVDLITNGFDEDDFGKVIHSRTNKFTIRHVGVVDELRDPRPVMRAIKEIIMVNPEFKQWVVIEFIGNVNSAFKKYVEQDDVLKEVTNFVDSIPHNELLKLYGKTDLQLLVLAYSAIAPGNLPGKFFEYLASGNPILAIGPINGDAADVLKQTKAGEIFERTDDGGIKQSIMKFYFDWKAGKGNDARDVSLYTRKALTERLSSLLQNL